MVDAHHSELDRFAYLSGQDDSVLDRQPPADSICHVLRYAREAHNQDLARIAQALRIRYVYLEAIENGQYDELPGPAYAVGFVRSYADFLGLDSREVVVRFKREVAGLRDDSELNFPTPAPQGKVPSGIVFLICVLIAALAYGGWVYLTEKDASLQDIVSNVPEGLQKLVDPKGAEGIDVAGTVTADPDALPPDPRDVVADDPLLATLEPAAEVAAPSPAETAEPSAGAADTLPPEDGAPVVETVQAADPVVAPQPAENPPAATEGTEGQTPETLQSLIDQVAEGGAVTETGSTVATSEQTASEQTAGEQTASEGTANEESGSQAAAAPEAPVRATNEVPTAQDDFETVFAGIPAAPAADAATIEQLKPQTYGQANVDSRIVLRALQDSWVQVRDSEGALLLTRVLRRGDSYRVPDQADLTLLTGNAGGLQVEVDGVPLPPLGAIGTVRRDISLDPVSLLATEG